MITYRIFIFTVTGLLFIGVSSCSRQSADTAIRPLTENDQAALSLIYSARLDSAENLINQAIAANPSEPKNHFLKATMFLAGRYFSAGNVNRDSLKQLLYESSVRTIDLAMKNENKTENKFYIGSAYGYLTRVHAMNRSWIKAFWSALKTKSYLKDVIEENPSFADAYHDLGFIYYFTSQQIAWYLKPAAWQWGLMKDKATAMDYLNRVYSHGSFLREAAAYELFIFNYYIDRDYDAGMPYIEYYFSKHPSNPNIRGVYMEARLLRLVNQKGFAYFNDNLDSIRVAYNIVTPAPVTRLGYRFIQERNFDDAIASFKINIRLFPNDANSYDSMGEAYMLAGNKDESIKCYNQAKDILAKDSTVTDDYRKFLNDNIQSKLDELKKM